MLSYRFLLAVICTLLAGSLYADKVTYMVGTGDKATVKFDEKAAVTSWAAGWIKFKGGDGKEVQVSYKDVVSIDRRGGSMSKELSAALDATADDPLLAVDMLKAVATSGNALDKEEAMIMRALLLDSESTSNPSLVAEATKAFDDYTKAYKAGYYAREGWRGLARIQEVKNVAAARETLKKMATADAALAREGNQLLGELEASQSKWTEAINAFKQAGTAAKNEKDRNHEYLALAWEGWMTLKAGNAAGARTLIETVTGATDFDDPATMTDEIALAVAYPALGDLLFDADSTQKAYDAYVMGAYYAWWTGGTREGHCLGRAYTCSKKMETTDAKWKKRTEKLRTALALGFPKVLAEVDKG